MNKFISTSAAFLLIVGLATAHAEIYSWVDKDGKKHFGEQVPKEYLNKSTEITVKPVNAMEAAKASSNSNETKQATEEQKKPSSPTEDTPTENLSSCEQQKRAYEQSVQCYSRCRNRDGGEENRVNNISACGTCVDVKKPDC
jgi:hypothetical protein